MQKAGNGVNKGVNGPAMALRRDESYFKGIAQKLVPFSAQTQTDDEGKTLYLIYDLNRVLGGLHIHPNDVIPKMVEKGFLLIEDKTVHSYWLDPDGTIGAVAELPTKLLQRLAKRLKKRGKQTTLPDYPGILFFLNLTDLQRLLMSWRYDPDLIIPQLEAKGYLVRTLTQKPVGYIIFHALRQSAQFTKKKQQELKSA